VIRAAALRRTPVESTREGVVVAGASVSEPGIPARSEQHMVEEANKTVVRRFIEEYQSGHDVAVAEALLADDFVDHSPFGPFTPDREGVLALFGALFGAFPDLRAVIHAQWADGDDVITRKTFRGTHDGEFMGIPPTGNAVEFDVIDVVTVRDGLMRAHWNVVDALTLMQQVGALPAMA
jgi:steroid delta-isomerase-like uncharacterized protein